MSRSLVGVSLRAAGRSLICCLPLLCHTPAIVRRLAGRRLGCSLATAGSDTCGSAAGGPLKKCYIQSKETTRVADGEEAGMILGVEMIATLWGFKFHLK